MPCAGYGGKAGGAWSWVGPIAIVVVELLLLLWTWRKWPDPNVDFGAQLYLPWRISEGAVLGRDLMALYGPLSPYVNAALFAAFGASLMTLVWANIVLLNVVLVLLYRLLCAMANRFAAGVTCLAFLTLFAFGQYSPYDSNFTFVCPYLHEATHGFLIAVAAFCVLWRYQRHGGRANLCWLGLCLGLLVITKPEFTVAAAGGLAVGVAGIWYAGRTPPKEIGSNLGLLALGVSIPITLCWALLSPYLGVTEALATTVNAWRHVADAGVTGLVYIRRLAGLDPLPQNLYRILIVGLWYVAAFASLAILAALPGRFPRYRRLATGIAGALAVAIPLGLLVPQYRQLAFHAPVQPLQVIVLALLALHAACGWRWRRELAQHPALLLRVAWLSFAFLLLLRMMFRPTVHHYGFVLVPPACASLLMAVLAWVPRALTDRYRASGGIFAAGALALMLPVWMSFLHITADNLQQRDVWVGEAPSGIVGFLTGDSFLASPPRGVLIERARRMLQEDLPSARTLIVVPESTMLNYLTRRINPSRYLTLNPPEFFAFGEPAILASYRRSPPDVVILAHRDTRNFGLPYFGQHYGKAIRDWIDANYVPWVQIGDPPMQASTEYGLLIFLRKPLQGRAADSIPRVALASGPLRIP